MSFDQWLQVKYIFWKNKFTIKKVFFSLTGICIFAAVLNSHLLFLNGNDIIVNGTSSVNCYEGPLFPLWEKIHLFIYSIGPFFVILCLNIHLLQITFKVSKLKRPTLLVISVVVILKNILFLLMTSPAFFVSGFYYKELIVRVEGRVLILFSDLILFTYHSINLFILIFSNKKLYNACKLIIGIKIQPKMNTTHVIYHNRQTTEFTDNSDGNVTISVF